LSVDEADAYGAAVRALRARGRFGIRLGLGRTRALLHALGDPHLSLRGPLIAGTNGKGSVQALVSSTLRAAGSHVGQTPKPHLVSYRERIVIGGRAIAPADFAALIDGTLAAADRVPRRLGPPTEFELLTAAAFSWFAARKVDVAVVEVGLGGRLDATNTWDGGVAAITNIGMDHMEHLGPTLLDIGREKAAIVKRGDLAVSGATGDGALPIRRRCRRLGVALAEVQPLAVERVDRGGLTVAAPGLGTLRVGLLGRHQAANAGVALGIIDALDRAGICSTDQAAVRRGFATARWPGRLELLSVDRAGRARPAPTGAPDATDPDVLLDGAHNADGAKALASAVDELRPTLSGGRPVLLMAAMADKDIEAMVAALARATALRDARIIATTVPDSQRSLDAASLAAAWRHAGSSAVAVRPDPGSALDEALGLARDAGGPLVVCGSLYLVGSVRARLVPDPPADAA
jgi:dihydrofolate synthase/folylpolyglutamate synthase